MSGARGSGAVAVLREAVMVAALMGIVGSAMLRIVDVRPLTAAAQSARTVSEVLAVWGE